MLTKIQPLIQKRWKVSEGLIPEWKSKLKKELKRTPIRQIWKKKTERLKLEGSESSFFIREVWDSRPHICEMCWIYIHEPMPVCFSHNLSKWRYPEFRMVAENIKLVCWEACHKLNDKKNKWNDQELIAIARQSTKTV